MSHSLLSSSNNKQIYIFQWQSQVKLKQFTRHHHILQFAIALAQLASTTRWKVIS